MSEQTPVRGKRGVDRKLLESLVCPVTKGPGLFGQHDGDAVADRVGQPRLLADQLLSVLVVTQRPLDD